MCNQRSTNVPWTWYVSVHRRRTRWPAWEWVKTCYNVPLTCTMFAKHEIIVCWPCRACDDVWQNFSTHWTQVNDTHLGVTGASQIKFLFVSKAYAAKQGIHSLVSQWTKKTVSMIPTQGNRINILILWCITNAQQIRSSVASSPCPHKH